MYAIRAHLERTGGALPPRPPGAPAVRDGLERGIRGPARLSHARIRVTPGAVDAMVFMAAGTLLEAEDGLRRAWGALTDPDGALNGWQLVHCEADSWLMLGLHEPPGQP
ncbi:hypothetical protein [Kitasatospora sp. NPDC057015]|uniref:hypothetical protein n=1 Tax=Kitasatospora sp. NPDC057015 TaxID=3346001 RepID=UPI00363165F9